MKYLIPLLLLALGALVAWFFLFRKEPAANQIITTQAPTGYAYGAPVVATDVPGPTYTEANLVEFPKVGVRV